MVEVLPRALVEVAKDLVELRVDVVVVECARHVAHLVDQAVQHLRIGAATREPLDRLARHVPEVVVLLIATRDADHLEPLGQRAFVREVVKRRQQLPMSEVAGSAEDHERGRPDGETLEPLDERVFLVDLGGDGCALHPLAPFEDGGDPVGQGADGLRGVAV